LGSSTSKKTTKGQNVSTAVGTLHQNLQVWYAGANRRCTQLRFAGDCSAVFVSTAGYRGTLTCDTCHTSCCLLWPSL